MRIKRVLQTGLPNAQSRSCLPPPPCFQCAAQPSLLQLNSRLLHPSGLSLDFPHRQEHCISTTLHTHCITSGSSLLLSSSLPPYLGPRFQSARLCVRSHTECYINENSKGGMELFVIFSLYIFNGLFDLLFFSVSTQARFHEPSSNAAQLSWFGRKKACPLNSKPRLLHQPSNPGRPSPRKGSWERTPKYEWLFQASVAVEAGCRPWRLFIPSSATQPMGHELHQALPNNHQWGRPLGLESCLPLRDTTSELQSCSS